VPSAKSGHFTLLLLNALTLTCFQVAIKLAPDRKKFMEIISGSGNINADIEKFCSTFSPLLEENHKFLVSSVQTIVLLG